MGGGETKKNHGKKTKNHGEKPKKNHEETRYLKSESSRKATFSDSENLFFENY